LINIIDTPIKEIRLGGLRTLRNLGFEYENPGFLSQVLDEKTRFVDFLANLIGEIVLFAEIDAKIRSEIRNLDIIFNENKAWKDVKFLEEIAVVLDILLVLTNVGEIEKKSHFNTEKLSKILLLLRPLVPAELKDKIDVILCVFCGINAGNP
jgi:hypothetical protein